VFEEASLGSAFEEAPLEMAPNDPGSDNDDQCQEVHEEILNKKYIMNNQHPDIQYSNISLSITHLVQVRGPPPYPISWIEGRDGYGGAT
jgi:hypothetical protein